MIFTSKDNKVAYYHAPKNGSRTMLGWLALTFNPNMYEKHPEYFHPRKDNVYSALRSAVGKHPLSQHDFAPNSVPMVTDTDYTFCIKRDPVKRFISGYRNRVLFHRELGSTPSISEFIDNFDAYLKYRTIRVHFMPQVRFFGKDPSIFDFVFDTENMGEVKEFLETVHSMTLPDLQLQQGGNEVKIKLTRQEEAWIRRRYADDYNAGWC